MKTFCKLIVLFFILQNSSLSKAQNLVPNGSFEVYDTCPNNASQIMYALPWGYPTTGTADYYNACSPDTLSFSINVPSNWGGHQYARTGNGYAGFFARAGGYLEYVQVKLIDSLIMGRKYCVSFHVSVADTCAYSINSVGMYISNTAPTSTNYFPLPFTPQIQNSASTFLNDTSWTEVSGEYIAVGGEKYITIGNFSANWYPDSLLINSDTVYHNPYITYLYLDDVSIIDCDTVTEIPSNIKNEALLIYPNPASDFLFIKNEEETNLTISIYNSLGALCYSKQCDEILFNIDMSGFASGLYYVNTRSEKGVFTQKIIVKKQ